LNPRHIPAIRRHSFVSSFHPAFNAAMPKYLDISAYVYFNTNGVRLLFENVGGHRFSQRSQALEIKPGTALENVYRRVE